ncbi:MAG: response regulator transcription factor [bacterium]|nr:MAG: response regulator transcription factor [bacterium]
MQIRVMIVDDEELARDEMRYLLGDEQDVAIVGEAASGEEAVELIREQRPDLVFLDIQMPEMDGFQVVRNLLENDEVPLIVFATAYDQYAIRAFEVNALDYLLKPIDRNRLHAALERARRVLPDREEFVQRIRKLTEQIKVGTRFLPRIVIRRDDELTLVDVEKVSLLHREGVTVVAHTADGDFETNYRDLDEIEVQLDPIRFVRLGIDYIVNLGRIAEIMPWSGGRYLMVMDDRNKTEVQLNRTQATLLKSKV